MPAVTCRSYSWLRLLYQGSEQSASGFFLAGNILPVSCMDAGPPHLKLNSIFPISLNLVVFLRSLVIPPRKLGRDDSQVAFGGSDDASAATRNRDPGEPG